MFANNFENVIGIIFGDNFEYNLSSVGHCKKQKQTCTSLVRIMYQKKKPLKKFWVFDF